jgi:hypothetical protein
MVQRVVVELLEEFCRHTCRDTITYPQVNWLFMIRRITQLVKNKKGKRRRSFLDFSFNNRVQKLSRHFIFKRK